MNTRVKNILLTVLACALLLGFACAVPSGALTAEAQRTYLNETPTDIDDDYAFLFDD